MQGSRDEGWGTRYGVRGARGGAHQSREEVEGRGEETILAAGDKEQNMYRRHKRCGLRQCECYC